MGVSRALGLRSGPGPNNRADEENQLGRKPVPARDYSQGDLALLVPAMQALLRQFGQPSAEAIYSVFGATLLPTLMRYAD